MPCYCTDDARLFLAAELGQLPPKQLADTLACAALAIGHAPGTVGCQALDSPAMSLLLAIGKTGPFARALRRDCRTYLTTIPLKYPTYRLVTTPSVISAAYGRYYCLSAPPTHLAYEPAGEDA